MDHRSELANQRLKLQAAFHGDGSCYCIAAKEKMSEFPARHCLSKLQTVSNTVFLLFTC